jgi:hypothetical protein
VPYQEPVLKCPVIMLLADNPRAAAGHASPTLLQLQLLQARPTNKPCASSPALENRPHPVWLRPDLMGYAPHAGLVVACACSSCGCSCTCFCALQQQQMTSTLPGTTLAWQRHLDMACQTNINMR